MTATEWNFVPDDGQLIGRTLGELLAAHVRKRWPRDTAKQVAKAWDLDATTAANLIKGHASERTITKAIRAEGWALLQPLGRALVGRTYEEHLQHVIEAQELVHQKLASRRDRVRDLEARAARLVGMGPGMGAQ